MIVRHIPMKKIRKSSFSGLIKYMINELGRQERVGEIHITNCQNNDLQWAIHEIQATQQLNQRAKGDKTYHLLISFPAGEIPSFDALKDIEAQVCASIGYGMHQRISVVHYDTDNFHIHVGINKIHPTRFTMHEPYLAYKKLGEIATALEIKHGLQQVNHIPFKIGSENRADDMEHHSGIGSLLNWIKSECLESLNRANNWNSFQAILTQHGLELRERGNGLVIVDGSGIGVKASSVSREFSKSKLEKQFGTFRIKANQPLKPPSLQEKPKIPRIGHKPPPRSQYRLYSMNQLQSLPFDRNSYYSLKPVQMKSDTTNLYKRYQTGQSTFQFNCTAELSRARLKKNQAMEAAKRKGRLKRAAIVLLGGGPLNKKLLYSLTSKTLKAELKQVTLNYFKEREAIYFKYQRTTWADWLKWQATTGDVEALKALRSRGVRQNLKGNLIAGLGRQSNSQSPSIKPDNITKTGTIIYRVGSCAIRDDGKLIKITRGSSKEGIAAALNMAIQRYGRCISVKGAQEFKEQIVQVTASMKLDITFDEPSLELRRQQIINNLLIKETNHEPSHQRTLKPRGTIRGNYEVFGTERTGDSRARETRDNPHGRPSKPDLGRIGQHPPPASKNRLRDLSELGVVHIASGGEMLLQSHVFSDLEQQGTQSDNGLRRNVSRAGVVKLISDAADKYIAERELKRQTIADIPKHRRYDKNDEGPVLFVGTRQVDGQLLALLKRDECIIVLPINRADVQKIKRLSIGCTVTLNSTGIVISKGRSR
ncbi:MAG: relaxase/mobilization nuclease domain-containing protein [Tatlockia sp.]|nr:relaxase/mobilization nuclease domain-containing protein [Tatlockia sp.]